jgi:ATP-dependent helicase/DNAse subunit B
MGIDSLSRGTLVHTVLELFWADVKDHETLVQLDQELIRNKVEDATMLALDRLERQQRNDIPVRQKRVEVARLHKIICQWLGKERGRRPFTVLETEKTHRIDVGGLSIRTRIDRVDRLEDGSCAVIDYKTGRPDPTQWLDERISEPQLPLYALSLHDKSLGAVMFAEVRSKLSECGFRGLARDVDSWPEAKSRKTDGALKERGFDSFDKIVQHWANALPALGNGFFEGKASVNPLDPELTCRYCDLASLCRVSETVSALPEGIDD